MNMKDFTDYVTLLGALVAAGVGVWNLILQMRGKRDLFLVRLGSLSPAIGHETMVSVVSRSDHPVRLTDWGFIEANGLFTSLIMEWESGGLQGEEISARGSSLLEGFGKHFETGCVRCQMPLGAYAISATQRSPVIAFAAMMPMWQRFWIRWRLLLQPSYLLW